MLVELSDIIRFNAGVKRLLLANLCINLFSPNAGLRLEVFNMISYHPDLNLIAKVTIVTIWI